MGALPRAAALTALVSWLAIGSHMALHAQPTRPDVDLRTARAHWVDEDTIVWPGAVGEAATARLHYDHAGGLQLGSAPVEDGTAITLVPLLSGVPAAVRDAYPHLAGARAYRIPRERLAEAHAALTGQVVVSLTDAAGQLVDATGVQLPGVLDALFAHDGPLGVTFDGLVPTLRVWAPTARQVELLLFDDAVAARPAETVPMHRDGHGVWDATGTAAWRGRYYLFRVTVFVASEGRILVNEVTDPYSVSLARNSARSQVVDLRDPALKPEGWDRLDKPPLDAPEDIALYELHVRDFSAADPLVPEDLRGTYRALTLRDTHGGRHLDALAAAGITHVHLLPVFDIATIDEDRSHWASPGDLSGFAPDATDQQARVTEIASRDGYNWGYDPYHYSVPEGSYSTDPQGPRRVREFREMVQSLNQRGLRVVMDVVYNHTTASGQLPPSVLDRIVPGYYHRLDADGRVTTSTCCANTATEHAMMEKLMIDSVLLWATQYKVDGFRFDLMGHHMVRNMTRLRARLDALTRERDGVDGRAIYVYGEGWDFGEVAGNARGRNATQVNLAGTGIGTFNDRVRDAVRGGTPFAGYKEQGFATGLATDPNAAEARPADAQRAQLLRLTDWVRLGLAGNLAAFPLVDATGARVTGADVKYFNDAPAGYAADPQETITYVEAHDNETLFDVVQAKAAASTTLDERVRMQMLGISLVALAQGVPFFHAGMELLRSKSMDRNSYDSGDWFNRLDYSRASTTWGAGLPPEKENRAHWPTMAPLLADPRLRPGRAAIDAVWAHVVESLGIRRSSPLFRLRDAPAVIRHLRFLNDGPDQLPGLIVMELHDETGAVDPAWARVVVVVNARPADVAFTASSLAGARLGLHPLQRDSRDARTRAASFDAESGTLRVGGRTTAVFVEER